MKIWVLLGKDARVFARSPAILVGLVLYPLLVALIVGLVVRYAAERPSVALVDEDGLPDVLVVGGQRFDVGRVLDRAAKDVELVRMPAARAERALETGNVLATVVIPDGFASRLRGMIESPKLRLRTSSSGLATRVVQQVQALVYSINLDLQKAYIDANLEYVDLLLHGGSGSFVDNEFDVIGLERAQVELEELARSRDPAVAAKARELAVFVREAILALGQTDESLRATANPIELVTDRRGGRSILLSARVQAYALALTLAFVAILLAAAAIASERDENVIGRLARGLVGLWGLVLEKVTFVAILAGGLGFLLALAFGLTVEAGGVPGGEPWRRLPLLLLGLLIAAAAFGSFGVLLGVLARESRAATLVAFLVSLPIILLGLVPEASVPAAAGLSQAFPFAHAVRFFSTTLVDADPAGIAAREAAWLAGLGAVFAAAARTVVRRLLA